MNHDEALYVLQRIYAHFPNAKIPAPTVIEDWVNAFASVPAAIVWAAYQVWAQRDTSGFPPHLGMIAREVNFILFPNLIETYEDAKRRNSPLYLKAVQLEGTYPARGGYNPHSSGIEESEVPFIEKRVRDVFNSLQKDLQVKPVDDLVKRLIRQQSQRTLRRISAMGVSVPKEALTPKLDESHDWKGTIDRMDDIRALVKSVA